MSPPAPARGPVRAVTVYCGSAPGCDPLFMDCARRLGAAMAERGTALVYGGGGIGLMGAVARSAKGAGGTVTGIITEQFMRLEQGWDGCDEMIIVPGMRERKAQLEERGDAFAVLPGGLGTYEEFFETLVGRVIGRHGKPIGVLNIAGYYSPLVELVEHGITSHFVRDAVRELMVVRETPEDLLDALLDAGAHPVAHDPKRMLPMHGYGGVTQ